MRLDLFVKLKYQSNTIISFVDIKYHMFDPLCGVNNCLTHKIAVCVTYSNDVSDLCGISSPYSKLRIPFLNHILYEDLCKAIFDLRIFFFLVFDHDFIVHIDFTRIAA